METPFPPLTRESMKWRDGLKLERPNLSYADLHTEITKNEDYMTHLDQRVESKSMDKEEFVKHMSNLPNYLERGENFREKAFNVGVLDWRRLEKWQYIHKQIPQKTRYCSPSSSNTSSFFSTDGSSARSSRGHSSSPSRQRIHRTTLQTYLKASPKDDYSQDLKSSSSMLRTYQPSNKHHLEIKPKECKRKDSGPHVIPEKHTSLNSENYGAQSLIKGKMKIQDDESSRGMEKLQEPCCKVNNHDCPERHENIVLLFPRDDPQNSRSSISCPSDSKGINGRRSIEASRRSFSDTIFSDDKYYPELYSSIPHSCPLPCDVESIEHSQVKQPNSKDAKHIEFSLESSMCSAKISSSPSRSKNSEEKKSSVKSTKSTVTEFTKVSLVANKVRSPSPFRRVGIGMGMIARSSISKNISDIPQVGSMTCKSGPEGLVSPTCMDDPSTDRPNSRSRGRSSPLRRLIDPFLKPKAENSDKSAEPSQKDSKSNGPEGSSSRRRSSPLRRLIDPLLKPKAENSYKYTEPSQKDSTNGRVESSAAHSLKGKLDCANCRAINVDDTHHNKNRGSSKVQALLRIVLKNGLPLFTFAVDNNSEILAATMKKLRTSEKDSNSWIYTFFAVREVNKKNGLMNGGRKGKGKGKDHGYVPNVIAQMKVSDSWFSESIKHKPKDQFSNREFVLFAMDPKQTDQQRSELWPNNELAAIVVKFPKEPLSEVRDYSNSRDNENNGSSMGVQDSVSTTVVLPSGVHGLSVKGEPSPLLERWKSGGLCDCGGWDVGCRIRVLSNQIQLSSKLKSSKAHTVKGQFELFSEGEEPDDTPVFSLSPFKDAVFSVEFGSSLTLLQAFAICVSVLNSKKPYELLELSKLFEEKKLEETTLVEHNGNEGPNHVSVASCPPDSAVERV